MGQAFRGVISALVRGSGTRFTNERLSARGGRCASVLLSLPTMRNSIYGITRKTAAYAACAESFDCPGASSSARWTSQQVVERGQRAAASVERKEKTGRASERSIDRHECAEKRKHANGRGNGRRSRRSRRKAAEWDMLEREKDGIVTERGFSLLVGYLRTVPVHNCPCHSATALNLQSTCTRRVTHAFPLLLLCLLSRLCPSPFLLHLRIPLPRYGLLPSNSNVGTRFHSLSFHLKIILYNTKVFEECLWYFYLYVLLVFLNVFLIISINFLAICVSTHSMLDY